MSFSADDARHMARALQLAANGLYTTDPNPRVGCVIVRERTVVGEGWHARAGEAHAEILALAQAGDRARGADVYLTLEPCSHHGRTPPCAEALARAGVRRVVVAMQDPDPRVNGRGLAQLARAGIECGVGLMAAQAQALNPGFISRLQRGRPFVRIKMAASLDGRTALAGGESRWITGDAARADVQRLRARSSAILTGVGTVLADDPSLTVRLFDIGRQPLRVVLDSGLRTPPTARMLRLPGRTLIVAGNGDARRAEALTDAGAEVVRLPGPDGGVDLAGLLRLLAGREINEVLVESGSQLAGPLLAQRLVDELVLYFAPAFLGDEARGMFHVPGLTSLADRVRLDIRDVRAVGDDWRITATVADR